MIFQFALPGSLALLLLPLALPGLRDPGRWVLAATPLTFLAGYLFYPTILSHYTVVVAPGLMTTLLKPCFLPAHGPWSLRSASRSTTARQ